MPKGPEHLPSHPKAHQLTEWEVWLNYHLPNAGDFLSRNFRGALRALDPRTSVGRIGLSATATGAALVFSAERPTITSTVLAQEQKDTEDVEAAVVSTQDEELQIPTPELTATPTPALRPATPEPTRTLIPTVETEHSYYTQILIADGVKIKAGAAVDQRALQRVREVFVEMTSRKPELRTLLAQERFQIAIFPRNGVITELPEFSNLAGQTEPITGYRYDSPCCLVGLGATRDRPISVVAESQMILVPPDGNIFNGMGHVSHEIAHGLELIFTPDQENHLRNLYNQAMASGRITKDNQGKDLPLAANHHEFWAECTRAYFGPYSNADKTRFFNMVGQEMYQFLQEVYGPR